MRWQTTAALAVVLAALAAFFYVYEIRLAPEREQAETRKGRLFTADLADVTELAIERPDGGVHVKREGDGWQMLAPVRAAGDRGTIDDVLTTIVTAKSDREIEAAPAPGALADFGLDKPAARVTLTLKDGRRVGLTLGGKNPTGAWVYAREADKPAVLALGESVLRDATRPAADFRDKTVLAFDRQQVTGIEVVTRDDTIVLASADGKWSLTRPRALPADADAVREFLDKLSAAKVREFVAESPASLGQWGLDQPTRASVVTGKDKDRARKTLLLGRVDAEKKGVYAMREGDGSVVLIPEDVWVALPKTVATARDKTVIDFDRDRVAKIELSSGKGEVTLVREDNRWRITGPEALPADQTEAGAILFKLKELKAQAFLSDDASAAPRYLARPDVKVTVTEQGGAVKTLLLASSSEQRGGRPSAYAGVPDRGPVVLVEGKAVTDLARSVTDLRDRTVVFGLDPKDVKRMAVRAGGKSVLLERSGDDWKVLEPAKGDAKSQKVDDVLFTLRSLRWKDIAAPASDPAQHGFAEPTFETSLYRADGTEIATVSVGKKDDTRAYVRTKAAPTVYAVDPGLVGDLPKNAEDLRG
jgi:hypothetical protein